MMGECHSECQIHFTPRESNTKVSKFDGNNTYRCSDKGGAVPQ